MGLNVCHKLNIEIDVILVEVNLKYKLLGLFKNIFLFNTESVTDIVRLVFNRFGTCNNPKKQECLF